MARAVKQAKQVRTSKGLSGVKPARSNTPTSKPRSKPVKAASAKPKVAVKPKSSTKAKPPAKPRAAPAAEPAKSLKPPTKTPVVRAVASTSVAPTKPAAPTKSAAQGKSAAQVKPATQVKSAAHVKSAAPTTPGPRAADPSVSAAAAPKTNPSPGKSADSPAKPAGTSSQAAGKSGKAKTPKEPVKPVISAKPGQILLTPLRPSGSTPPTAPKPSSPTPVPAEPPEKKTKAPINPPPLPPAPVTTDSKAKKNQAGLTAKELDFFRDLLLAKRREIVGDMSSMEREALRGAGSNLSNLPVHMADMGTDNYEQEFTLGLVEKDRQMLREINLALAKIQNGTYGICEGTGKPISKARLEAQPWSKYSIEYVRTLESRKFVRR